MFEEEGLERYVALQLELEDQPFTPGVSFPFVKVTTGLSKLFKKRFFQTICRLSDHNTHPTSISICQEPDAIGNGTGHI